WRPAWPCSTPAGWRGPCLCSSAPAPTGRTRSARPAPGRREGHDRRSSGISLEASRTRGHHSRKQRRAARRKTGEGSRQAAKAPWTPRTPTRQRRGHQEEAGRNCDRSLLLFTLLVSSWRSWRPWRLGGVVFSVFCRRKKEGHPGGRVAWGRLPELVRGNEEDGRSGSQDRASGVPVARVVAGGNRQG